MALKADLEASVATARVLRGQGDGGRVLTGIGI